MSDEQEKIARFQVLQQTFQTLKERQQVALQRLQELETTKQMLVELENVKESTSLIPIGSENYLFGKIDTPEKILVGIGGGVVVKKDRADALKITTDKSNDVQKLLEETLNQEQQIGQELQTLQLELEQSMREQK